MKNVLRNIAGVMFLVLLFLAPAGAQQQGQSQTGQQPPKQPTPPGQPGQAAPAQPPQPETPPVNPEEEAAFKTLSQLPPDDPARQIEVGEEFIKKFPESRYRPAVYLGLVRAYYRKGEVDKMVVAAEKALELHPDYVDVLPWISMVLPRVTNNPRDLDYEQKLQKAEKYAKRGIELLDALTKPENLTEEQFTRSKNIALSMCHSGLGVVYFRRGLYAEAVPELNQASQLVADPDPVDFYLLGISQMQIKKFADAVGALEKCSQMPGSLQETCKQNLQEAKKLAATPAQPAAPKP